MVNYFVKRYNLPLSWYQKKCDTISETNYAALFTNKEYTIP